MTAKALSARAEGTSGPLVVGHRLLGVSLMIKGDFSAALPHLERAVALYDPKEHHALTGQFGQDIGIAALCWLAFALWHQGYPERALKMAHEAVDRARRISHLYSLVYALDFAAYVDLFARDIAAVEEHATALVALARGQRFPFFSRRGWCST